MNYENKDRELDLKALCFCVARKWKLMLVVAVVLALALGGFRGWKGYSAAMDTQAQEAQKAAYEEAYAKYQTQLATIDTKIAQVETAIAKHGVYLGNSLLQQIDYRNTWTASLVLYVQTQEKDTVSGTRDARTQADVIADAYRNMLVSEAVMEKAAQELEIPAQYLRELISMPPLEQRESQQGPLITVLIRSGDEETAQAIMDTLRNCLNDLQEEVSAAMGKHTLNTVSGSVSVAVDMELAELQEDAADRLLEYVDYLEDYQSDRQQLSAPGLFLATKANAVKDAVKYAVVGGLVGVFFVAAVACVQFVVGDKVYSARELKSRFGVTLLGKMTLKKKRCCIDRLLDRLEDRGQTEEQGALAVMCANIATRCGEKDTLLVAGTAAAADMEKIMTALTREMPGRNVICGGSLLDSPVAIQALPKCTAVVLVERCGESRYDQVAAQLEAVKGMDKTLLGCVVLEK